MNNTGYAQGSGSAQGITSTQDDDFTHAELKKQYLDYLAIKNEEIKEQQNSRRYYHGAQWTAEQIKVLNKRKQPIVTYNRIGRKINAIVGLLEKQRTDPKGFPRTPKHEEGAEIATAVLRYVCDEQRWQEKSPLAGLSGAVDGIGGIELMLEQGDKGDVEVGLDVVDPSSYFYDPRSLKADFADAAYQGIAKWADIDQAIELAPDKEEEIRASVEAGSELTTNPDYEKNWFSTTDGGKKVRIVDHWYYKRGKWFWCLYTGSVILQRGESMFVDEKGRTSCKFIMYSANVDHDGDRYGFVRNMRSSQDEINQRRSKGLHNLNTRRVVVEEGTQKIEQLRVEAARPDGVIQYPQGSTPPQFDDAAKAQELAGQLSFLEDAKQEIENYGFNPALIGTGVQDMSGRAIQLQQQAGIAELGPYLLSFKAWKLRVFRAIWNAIQQHWTAERWIRVTDDQQTAQFFAVNQVQADPVTGQPMMVNGLGSLDVDVIIDEGPDTINMQADAYDTLSIMASKGQQVPPEVLIELSPLAGSVKKKVLGILEQAKQQAAQPNPLVVADAQAGIADKQASAMLKQAQARKALSDAGPQGAEGPSEIDVARALAEIRNTNANTEKTIAETQQTEVETALKPVELQNQQQEKAMDRQERFAFKRADMSQTESQTA